MSRRPDNEGVLDQWPWPGEKEGGQGPPMANAPYRTLSLLLTRVGTALHWIPTRVGTCLAKVQYYKPKRLVTFFFRKKKGTAVLRSVLCLRHTSCGNRALQLAKGTSAHLMEPPPPSCCPLVFVFLTLQRDSWDWFLNVKIHEIETPR